jgi:hypothetical protein
MINKEDINMRTIRHLQKMLEDEDYFYSWQANIAMKFIDEYNRHEGYVNRKHLHKIANQAAKNFLKLFMK